MRQRLVELEFLVKTYESRLSINGDVYDVCSNHVCAAKSGGLSAQLEVTILNVVYLMKRLDAFNSNRINAYKMYFLVFFLTLLTRLTLNIP